MEGSTTTTVSMYSLSTFDCTYVAGLKDTRGIKSQKCSKFGEAGLILASCTKVLDVPCADCFTSDDVFVVKDAGDGKVSVEVTFEVKFVKSTMMK